MDRSVKRYKERRDKRIEEKNGTRYDSVDAFRARRLKRLQARFDANPQIAYGIAKGMGIDTTGMEPKEVWEAIRKEGGGRGVNVGKKPNTTNAPSTASNRGHIGGVSAEAAKEAGYFGGWLPPKVSKMPDAEVHKVMTACHKIGGGHYDKASKVALEEKNAFLRTFTTHNMDHVQQVIEKTNQAADAIEQIKDTHVFSGAKIDRKTMLFAAWFHDTGMDGGDGDWSGDNGNGIRKAHGVNSAMHILEHAKEMEAEGVNPSEVALIAFAHTKSMSGISDLTKPSDWLKGIRAIQGAVDEYNKRNPNNKIEFNAESVFEGGKPNTENIKNIAGQVAALRLGDANREANIPLRSQAGGKYDIDKQPDYDACTGLEEEENASEISITLGEGDKAQKHHLKDGDPYMRGVDGFKFSKHVVLGERNMTKIDTEYNPKHDSLQLNVDLADGNASPWSTKEALLERCGELNTINGVPRAVKVKMTGVNSPDDMHENAINAYMTMWHEIQTSPGKKPGELKYDGIDDVVLEFGNGEKVSFKRLLGNVSGVKKVEEEYQAANGKTKKRLVGYKNGKIEPRVRDHQNKA